MNVFSTVGESEEGLLFVRNNHRTFADRNFTVGVSHEALKLDAKRTVDMGTRLALKIHERGDEAIKPKRHVFVPRFRTKEQIMAFL